MIALPYHFVLYRMQVVHGGIRLHVSLLFPFMLISCWLYGALYSGIGIGLSAKPLPP